MQEKASSGKFTGKHGYWVSLVYYDARLVEYHSLVVVVLTYGLDVVIGNRAVFLKMIVASNQTVL